ncbi:MAG TPA: hypothetical protein VJ301_11715 [Propionibacteriaceae bacterium]|nr:hypothetical protein [Propionibacteriaceae bacterium]
MSAFVVDRVHIDLLVRTALEGPSFQPANERWNLREYIDRPWPDELGQLLIAENVASVRHRYPNDPDHNLPGPIDAYWQDPYTYTAPPFRLTIAEAFKALACYEYQACKHPGWEDSRAYKICREFRSALIDALPGYREAPWEWTVADVLKACEPA